MSETLLDALMQLFALLTDINKESITGRAHSLVEDFLDRNFNRDYVEEYLRLFDKYLDSYHNASYTEDKKAIEKQLHDNYSSLLSICEKLNLEMEQEPKILLFLQLVEFLKKEEEITEEENHFIDTLADKMKLNEADYLNLKTFLLNGPTKVTDKSKILLISGDEFPPDPEYKFIHNPKQLINVWVVHIQSTNTFIFKYIGDRNLYLNGHKIEQDRGYVLAVGSVIKTSRMGPVYYGKIAEKFIHREDIGRIIYRALNVEYKFNNNQIGIHRFSFVGRSGQLVGIMGGSGTGKSTLLNVLNGNYKLSHGRITINGYDLKEDKEILHGIIGFVPQDDLLIEELTVFENLYFNAKLCFSDLSEEEIILRVEQAIKDFDLIEARDLVVGNPLNKILSGGQRKRVNIALELIREPSVLFVDEPTSGLSSMDSEKVMVLLKRQTLKGKLVIINIHQPSSDLYKLLEKLLIIDKGGRIIYNGNPMDAIAYFKKSAKYVNPEERECHSCGNVKTEQPLRIIEARMVNPYGKLIRKRKVAPEEWYQHYIENFENKFDWKSKASLEKKEKLPPNKFSIPTRVKQFLIYSTRDALSKIKDKQYLLINFIEAPILAIILGYFTKFISTPEKGYIFSENVNLPAYLFMSVVVAIFLGLNVSAEEIIKDKKLLQRESFLNLSRFSYLNSKVLIMFTISAIQTLSFVLIGNAILELKGLTISTWLILFSTSCFANILGLNISSGLKSVVAIYILIPLILVPQLLFSGVIVSFEKLHDSIASEKYVPRIGDWMTSRWAYEALAVNQFKNNKFQKTFFADEQEISNASYCSSLLLPELKQLSANIYRLSKLEAKDTTDLSLKIDVLKNEIAALAENRKFTTNATHCIYLLKKPFNEETYECVNDLLLNYKKESKQRYNFYSKQKDIKYRDLIAKLGSSDAVYHFKQTYFNQTLSDWVLNKLELKQIKFNGLRFVQQKHPIYKAPAGRWGRAHFYAPYKNFGAFQISTPVFNTLFIWLTIIFLYITLYFDVLRRLLNYIEGFQLRKLNKRIQKLST